jgi:Flp pilus assembly protein CpaB
MAVGAFLMLACALAAGVSFSNVANRTPVLVVARPVTAGQVIQSTDLREALVGSDAQGATIAASRRSSIIGRSAGVELVEGAILDPALLADGPAAGTGQAVVGATRKEGQFPVELSVGDRVLAVRLPSASATAGGDPPTPTPISATVVGVRPLDAGGGVAVSLAVGPDLAPKLAVAGARSELSLVLAPR